MVPTEAQLQAALDDVGVSCFRPLQREAVCALLSNTDVLCILKTGGGKSLVFQLPAVVTNTSVVVISPLLALAKDQVEKWNDVGSSVPAAAYNSTCTDASKLQICRNLASGDPIILYTTPESLLKDEPLREAIAEAVANDGICAVAIDEAHCAAEWGHDFRPAYLQIRNLRQGQEFACFGRVPFCALTATATHDVRSAIVQSLGLLKPQVFEASFNRSELLYSVRYKEALASSAEDLDPDCVPPCVAKDMADFILAARGQGIVYARKRAACESVACELNALFDALPYAAAELEVAAYHAGMDPSHRARVQKQWNEGALTAVVATVAFGMGIDKADIRFVLHYQAPSSFEALTQEMGRAGRDGAPSHALIYTSAADREWAKEVCKAQERDKLAAVLQYCTGGKCRRAQVLAYFGEKRGGGCEEGEQQCDVCQNARAVAAMRDRANSNCEALTAEPGAEDPPESPPAGQRCSPDSAPQGSNAALAAHSSMAPHTTAKATRRLGGAAWQQSAEYTHIAPQPRPQQRQQAPSQQQQVYARSTAAATPAACTSTVHAAVAAAFAHVTFCSTVQVAAAAGSHAVAGGACSAGAHHNLQAASAGAGMPTVRRTPQLLKRATDAALGAATSPGFTAPRKRLMHAPHSASPLDAGVSSSPSAALRSSPQQPAHLLPEVPGLARCVELSPGPSLCGQTSSASEDGQQALLAPPSALRPALSEMAAGAGNCKQGRATAVDPVQATRRVFVPPRVRAAPQGPS